MRRLKDALRAIKKKISKLLSRKHISHISIKDPLYDAYEEYEHCNDASQEYRDADRTRGYGFRRRGVAISLTIDQLSIIVLEPQYKVRTAFRLYVDLLNDCILQVVDISNPAGFPDQPG